MNIKQFILATSVMLFSSQALSSNSFFLLINDFIIDEAAQKLSSGSLLGKGWQTFSAESNEDLCEAYMPGKFNYTTSISESSAGISSIRADSQSYPVFKTNIDGIGYIMGYRQSGTSQWYPITSTEELRNTHDNTDKLFLDAKIAFVKTVSGEIKKTSSNRITLESLSLRCNRVNTSLTSGFGLIMRSSVFVTWKATSCEVKTKRETVDLGTHELVAVRKLGIGDNFGYAQQSMTVECPENMIVDYTIADNNNPNNIGSDIIYLENQSDNPGFGVQMFESGSSEALKLGGDRKTPGNYQYSFAKTTNKKEVINKDFDFKYVKLSDNVKASDGNAKVTVTLVYR
ncbi:fimbrial protein [Proteus sp. fly-1013]|uniref:fimbrial protein n=1 Tax=Proteus sp. fly-1013 TaxID=3136673 RepID=UPI0032DAF6ED